MTDADLFRIFFAEPTPTNGLRAVFNAGTESVLDIVQISDEEIAEVLSEQIHHSRAADTANCDCNRGDLVSDGRRQNKR